MAKPRLVVARRPVYRLQISRPAFRTVALRLSCSVVEIELADLFSTTVQISASCRDTIVSTKISLEKREERRRNYLSIPDSRPTRLQCALSSPRPSASQRQARLCPANGSSGMLR